MIKKLYTYIITTDNGRSPCYDNGRFSLACCKPQIRRMILKDWKEKIDEKKAEVWLCGIQRENKEPFVVFLAKINKVLELQEYYNDNSEYAGRNDNWYRDIGTIRDESGKLPVTLTPEIIKKCYEKIHTKKPRDKKRGNEHGKVECADKMTKVQCRDIAGAAVLISDEFIHCSCKCLGGDRKKLTAELTQALGAILKDYKEKNRRVYHSFDDWTAFDKVIKAVEIGIHNDVEPVNTDKDWCRYNEENPACGGC